MKPRSCSIVFLTMILLLGGTLSPTIEIGQAATVYVHQRTGLPSCLHPKVAFQSNPPPAGWSPIAASDAELACYGFPSRPNDPTGLAGWTKAMMALRTFLPSVPNAPPLGTVSNAMHAPAKARLRVPSGTGIWGGYDSFGAPYDPGPNGHFIESVAEWTQQSWYSRDGHVVTDWVGLGGSGNAGDSLFQAGTYMYDPGCSTCGSSVIFFYEKPPLLPRQLGTFGISAGQTAYVDVKTNWNWQQATYFAENMATGQYTTLTVTYSGNVPVDSYWADFVAEDATVSTNGCCYTAYYPLHFTYA